MNEGLKDLLARRRDRAIAKVLSLKDDYEDEGRLDLEAGKVLRKAILDEFNDFYEIALDLINSVDDGTVVINQEYLERIDDIYDLLFQQPEEWREERRGRH